MTNICANFLSVKTAPTQKSIHLLISMQFEIWMKEIIFLYQNNNSLLFYKHSFPLATNTEYLTYVGYAISPNYPLFLNIKLYRNKAI